MSDSKKVRETVSETYAKAVSGPSTGCCGPEPQKGALAKLAGYTEENLASIPADAAANSFGCGNPLAFSGVREGEVVLDLGSGAGIDIILAGKMVGLSGRVIGIDMTDEMIERARENIAAAGLENVDVRKGIIEDMPVEDSSVDWVISNCVINLSPEKDKVFSEIHRVLKPGGRMLVSDIVARDLPEWALASKELYCSCISGAISEEDYLAGLGRAGLVEVEVRERLHYDPAQISALIESEITDSGDDCACCGGLSLDNEIVQKAMEEFAGKIWSAKFHGVKPR